MTDTQPEIETDATRAATIAESRILLIEPNRQQVKRLKPVLRSLVGSIDQRDSLGEPPDVGQYDLVIVTYDSLSAEERQALVHRFGGDDRGMGLLLLSSGECQVDYANLFESRTLTNLVAKNSEEVNVEELIVTTKKILTHDIFGMEKYFAWGVEPKRLLVNSSTQRDEVLELARDYAKSIGVGNRLTGRLCTVTDELVTNALYNSPIDETGRHLFAHLSRSEVVRLDDEKPIEVKFCSDGRRIGVSTTDPYGSLTPEQLLDYLAKCFRRDVDQIDDKPGGAGLGLYYIFDSVTHFVVNISPTRRTEFIGLISIDGSLKDFKMTNKSFNVFVDPNS